MEPNAPADFRPFSAAGVQARDQRPLPLAATRKARQSSKIRELVEAVISAGFLSLDEQAKALGLSRSTAWTIRKASHKASGLSASIINRMLAAPELPPLARSKILEYVEEKAAGLYGGSRSQRRKFAARLSIEQLPVYRATESILPSITGSPARIVRGCGSPRHRISTRILRAAEADNHEPVEVEQFLSCSSRP
jgi:predicted DNA-binding transcriptional regulator AlpA